MSQEELIRRLKTKVGIVKPAARGQLRIACPTCDPHNRKKCKRYVYPNSDMTKCYICGVPLSLQQLLGGEFVWRGGSVPVEQKEHPMAKVFPAKNYIPINQLEEKHPAVQFLAKDHLFDLTRYWEQNRLAFIPYEHGSKIYFESGATLFSGDSLVFPVFFSGELVGWQLRWIPGTFGGNKMEKLRYLHVFNKGSYLFNYDNARQYRMVVVMEGAKKALKIHNGVSTLGKSISERQMQLIQHWNDVVFFSDGEDATQAEAEKYRRVVISNGKRCVRVDPRDFGKPSPDEMTEEEVLRAVYTTWVKHYGG
jgi:hypothetical protein